ncbi:sucrase ferredoxin [Gaiella sp.]|uniref:sucrase ferredoxin n=1 Tax=Gaiella sp. TaxID=2663207 RepID=UPI0039839804
MSPDKGASRLRCSFAADERGDQLAGTAAHARGFLLIESPGAWGPNALSESRLDPEIASIVATRAAAVSYRVLLIKRPGRSQANPRRRWFVIDSSPGAEAVIEGSYASDRDLLDIPLDAGRGDGTLPTMYLVCTHGRHDACCALRGRAVAASLVEQRPDLVWECSHIGGDRFAPNVLVLPQGLYYGRVQPSRSPDLIESHERSEVVVDLLRGRAAFRPVVQAAQHFARIENGSRSITDLEPLWVRETGTGEIRVDLAHREGTLSVTVRAVAGETAGLLTCKATHPMHPPSFALQAIDTQH